VILTPPSCDNEVVLELLDKAGTPYVRLGPEKPEGLGPRVHMDDVAAAREMTDHLIGLGHTRIGFITGDQRYGASQARREGYVAAMKARGLKVDKAWIREGDFTFESGHKAATALLALPERPTAIFASERRHGPGRPGGGGRGRPFVPATSPWPASMTALSRASAARN
jgi:LacI family transcriptional regulator